MILRCHFMLKYVFFVSLSRFFCLAFGDNYVKVIEATPILSVTKMFASESSIRQFKVYANIH